MRRPPHPPETDSWSGANGSGVAMSPLSNGSWALARQGDLFGDVRQANVEALGGAAQHLEGFIGRDAMAFHQDALALAYDVAVADCNVEALFCLGGTEGCAGKSGEEDSDLVGFSAEGRPLLGVEVQGAQGVAASEKAEGQH